MIAQGLATFAAMAALDFVWADYNRAIVAKQAAYSAALAAALIALNALVVLSYADDHWMIGPAVLGAFVGTYVSVRRH